MSTRSTITVKVSENECRSIYCHFDGYASHHYPILSTHYNTQALAESLVSLGELSSLDTTVETNDYYGRDRKEDGCEFKVCENVNDVYDIQSYHYYWNGEKWEVTDVYDDKIITEDCENGKFEY